MRRAFVCLALLLGWLLAQGPAPARSQPFITGFADGLFPASDAAVRDHWLGEAAGAAAGIVRLGAGWSSIAPTQPPSGLGAEPGWPGYRWDQLDGAVRSASAHGLKVMITASGAPRWAEGADMPSAAKPGTWKPDPIAYGVFAKALARRYSGNFPDPEVPGATLPRVSFFEAWNEPNLDEYLSPQWRDHELFAAGWYRDMLNRFYAGVKSVQPHAKVIAPGTAPYGDRPGGSRSPPVLFVRSLFCMKVGHLKSRGCPARTHLDVFSHHPINVGKGPTAHAVSPLDVSPPDVWRLTAILHRAAETGRVLPHEKRPVWATELWWDSDPPDPIYGAPLRVQARWMELADYVLWRQGVSTVVYMLMVDAPLVPPDYGSLQSGIFFIDGRRKPSYTAFRFPFVVRRIDANAVLAWGIAPVQGPVRVQRLERGRWATVGHLHAAPRMPFQLELEQRGSGSFRAVSAQGASLTWRQN